MKRTKKRYNPIREEGKQVGKFSITGVLNTGIDFGVYNVVILLLGFGVIPANLVSTTIAMTFSFIANKTYVFGSNSQRILTQAALFLLVTAIGLYVVQTGVISVLLYVWQAPLELIYQAVAFAGFEGIFPREVVFINGAKIIATGFSLVWNYTLYRNIVFNDRRNYIFEMIGDWFADHRHLVLVAGVLAMAAVFRFWQLDVLPPGLHPEEAAGGLVATAIAGGDIQAIFDQAGGYGAPFHLLQTASVSLFGNTVLALRYVPALLGVLGVLFTYMAAKTWFSQRTALVASFFMASAPWAVHLSRISEPMVLSLALVPLGMWLAGRAIQTNNARWYVGTGITLGGLWYAGIPYYVWIVFLLLIGVYALRYYRDYLAYPTQPILIVALSAVITILPLLIYSAASLSIARIKNASVDFSTILEATEGMATAYMHKGIAVLGMFHFTGDRNIIYNLPGEPLLNGLVGILFVLGILLAFRRFRDIRYTVLLGIVAVMALPVIFTAESTPSALWSIGMLPAVYILAAIGLVELFARWRGVFPRNVLALQFSIGVILVMIGVATVYNWERYFIAWANMPETFAAYHEQARQTAAHLNRTNVPEDTYVITDDASAPIVRYLTEGNSEFTIIPPEEYSDITLNPADMILISRGEATNDIRFPGYQKEDIYSSYRPNTVLYTVYTP